MTILYIKFDKPNYRIYSERVVNGNSNLKFKLNSVW